MIVQKDKAIKKKFSASLMSNKKWKKFFKILIDLSNKYGRIEYKFVFEDKLYFGSSPINENDIWDEAIDHPVLELGGPIEYKHIEWIKIPNKYSIQPYKNAPKKIIDQDINELILQLNKSGKFPVLIENGSFFIYGYKV